MNKKPKKMRRAKRQAPAEIASLMLRFTPLAWAKLLFLRDYGETEVGGFGLSRADDLLLVEDIRLVDQVCSWAHVAFADESVADYFDDQVDLGRRPEQFGRIWVHTHPGDCPNPSGTDEQTFERVFGGTDWSVMFILARCGQTYARLRLNVGLRGSFEIPVEIDYRPPFPGCDQVAWEEAYLKHVQIQRQRLPFERSHLEPGDIVAEEEDWYETWFDYTDAEDQTRGFTP